MRAAIYARKSTEQNVSDDAKSVTRQVELARAFATRQGWTAAESHVYIDDGICGAEFVGRPGLAALTLAARGKPRPFDVLVTMDVDRIGREQFAVASELLRIVQAGVRVFFYATGKELKFDTPISKITLSLQGYAAEDYRHQIQTKTKEALHQKAARGFVANGKVLGYVNVRESGGVKRVIDADQAAIIRRIFQLCAEGYGSQRIAQLFNREGLLNPTGQERRGAKKAGSAWASSNIREVLRRDLYRGVVAYGKTRREDRDGRTKIKMVVPKEHWITRADESLRIVSDTLWQAAHRRLDKTRAVYQRDKRGQLQGKPESGLDARYLLSGFLVCGHCGSPMMVIKRTRLRGGRQSVPVYICSKHRTRGKTACPVYNVLPAQSIHAAVVWVFRNLLTPEALETHIQQYVAAAATPESAAQRATLVAEIERLDGELARLGDAVAGGAALPTLLEAMTRREADRQGYRNRLEALDALARTAAEFDAGAYAAELRATLTDWTKALDAKGPHAATGRRIVRSLLNGPITLTRVADGWAYRGETVLNRAIRGLLGLRVLAMDLDQSPSSPVERSHA
jgi:DNA invertase Pin-like site-specific DNA recombinase